MERLYVGALVSTYCNKDDLRWYLCSQTGKEFSLITGTTLELCGNFSGRLTVIVKRKGYSREYHLTPSEIGL